MSHTRSLLSLEPTECFSYWPDSTEKARKQAKPDACSVCTKAIRRGVYRLFAIHYAAVYRVSTSRTTI
jgi:hypothetical protein